MGGPGRWAPLLLLLGLLAPPPAEAQAGGGAPEVIDLDFTGNEAFPDDSLALAIVNRETVCPWYFKYVIPFCPLGFETFQRVEFLDRRELPRDVARLRVYHFQRGYREARVDTALVYAPDSASVALTFSISEGTPVRIDTLRVLGTEEALVPGLLDRFPVSVGDPLSAIQLDAARDTLMARLRNAGYYHADVFRNVFTPADSYGARVVFDVDPGPRSRFGEIEITVAGESELADEVVRRMLTFQEGDLYQSEQVEQAQRNLFNLEIVRSVTIHADSARIEPAVDTLIPHHVDVGTSTLRRVRAGAGWSQSDCMNAEALWVNRNFRGGARRVQLRGRLSNLLAEELYQTACPYSGVDNYSGLNWLLSAEINQPWVGSPRNSLTGSIFWERQSVPDVFIRQAVGLNLVFTRSLARGLPLVFSVRPQRARLEAAEIFFCTGFLVCDPQDISALQSANKLVPVAVGATLDRTDNFLNPSEGYLAHAEVEYASSLTLSDFAYTRAVADASWYRSLAQRTLFALRVRAGWVGAAQFVDADDQGIDVIHPQKRFFAGGSTSVRGFTQNRLGPLVLTTGVPTLIGPAEVRGADTTFVGPCTPQEVADLTCDASTGDLSDAVFIPRPTGGTRLLEGNVEYRFAFGGEFQAVTFLDFGGVWSERQSVSLGDVEWTPGLGVRWFSPIGPIRADLAYRFAGGQSLPVVTPRIRPLGPGEDLCDPDLDPVDIPLTEGRVPDPCSTDPEDSVEFVRIPWVREGELVFMAPPFPFEDDLRWFSRLQLHISIGQAF